MVTFEVVDEGVEPLGEDEGVPPLWVRSLAAASGHKPSAVTRADLICAGATNSTEASAEKAAVHTSTVRPHS